MRKLVFVFLVFLNSIHHVLAFSTVSIACPVKFLGTILEVRELNSSQIPKVSVRIKTEEVLKGNVPSTVLLEVLRDGPIKFKPYQRYVVEMNDGYLCQAANVE